MRNNKIPISELIRKIIGAKTKISKPLMKPSVNILQIPAIIATTKPIQKKTWIIIGEIMRLKNKYSFTTGSIKNLHKVDIILKLY